MYLPIQSNPNRGRAYLPRKSRLLSWFIGHPQKDSTYYIRNYSIMRIYAISKWFYSELLGYTLRCQFSCECPITVPVASQIICHSNLSSPVVLPPQCPVTRHKAENFIAVVVLVFLCENLCYFWMTLSRFCVLLKGLVFSRLRHIAWEMCRESYCIIALHNDMHLRLKY